MTKNMTAIVRSVKPGDTVTELVTNTTVTLTGSTNDVTGLCSVSHNLEEGVTQAASSVAQLFLQRLS